ncbi:MAG: PspA/IM30 family protein [Pseudomonadota bacterium]
MYKQVWTLIRGTAYSATESFTDRHALLILQQQMRDSAQAVAVARKAVALAMAQNKQEEEQYDRLLQSIEDLEERAVSALEQGKTDLAREAAETIAQLEAERDASQQAQHQFSAEIQQLKTNVRDAESRLRDLQRGHRLADATDKAHRLRQQVPATGLASLSEAEATLERLRQRQREIDLTAEAMRELDVNDSPSRISEKLAEAGCGKPIKSSADDVLDRLTKRVAAAESKPNDGNENSSSN